LAFHPYPQVIQKLFNVYWFGPPEGVTPPSSCPWVDRKVSRPPPATPRPVEARFRFGSAPEGLNLAAEARLVGSLCKRHTVTPKGSDRSQAHGFRVCFTPLSRVLFTFPSRYWYTIGHTVVFSLAGWCRPVPAGFLRSRGTQGQGLAARASRKGLSPSMARLSSRVPVASADRLRPPYNPADAETPTVWANPRSLAATRGIPVLVSSPPPT
jgi:hypothetical protein